MTSEGGQPEVAEASPESFVTEHRPRSPLARLAKLLARQVALVLVSPRLVAYLLRRLLVDRETAFAAASESIARIPGLRGVYMRQAFYGFTLEACGEDVYFGWMTAFSKLRPRTRSVPSVAWYSAFPGSASVAWRTRCIASVGRRDWLRSRPAR